MAARADVGCFLRQPLVKPAAGALVLAFVVLVGWVMTQHVSGMSAAGGIVGTLPERFGLELIAPDLQMAKMLSLPPGEAVLVNKVLADSPAQKAGLAAGDGIVAVDGRAVSTPAEVGAALGAAARGDLLRLTVIRGGLVHSLPLGGR